MPRKLVGRYEILQPSGITYPILQQLFLDIARREAGSFPRRGCQTGDENLQTEGGALEMHPTRGLVPAVLCNPMWF